MVLADGLGDEHLGNGVIGQLKRSARELKEVIKTYRREDRYEISEEYHSTFEQGVGTIMNRNVLGC